MNEEPKVISYSDELEGKYDEDFGVIPAQKIRKLIERGIIAKSEEAPGESIENSVQPASLDLTLGNIAYRLQASFLPQTETVTEGMKELVMYQVDLTKGAILEKGAVYLIPLCEELKLPHNIRGKTNPKSSTGRLDIFTRVITDNCSRFEEIAPSYHGGLYLEVVPRSFTVKVTAGQRLNQLRLFHLSEFDFDTYDISVPTVDLSQIGVKDLRKLYRSERLLFNETGEFIEKESRHLGGDGLLMSVNLAPSDDGLGGIIGYKTKKNSHVIDLANVGGYDADDYWEVIHPPKNGKLILEPEEFYIFASKEFIRVPLDYASEMVEFDAGSGELRTHYAGFFDPGFGYGKEGEVKGTKAVLEVRPHDVPFIVEDGQILFKMKYEKMMEKPNIYYGAELGSNYHNQSLKLSKLFRQ